MLSGFAKDATREKWFLALMVLPKDSVRSGCRGLLDTAYLPNLIHATFCRKTI
jgi:hypothetical protein